MSETFNQKQYNQAIPIPAKFLLPDGTVVDELPTTGGGGGSGGTTNYNDLMNKPKINGNTLRDNLTANDLGLASKTEVENKVEKEDGKGLISNAEKEQITKNKTAIEVLNGDESVEGSVIKQIATALGKLNTLTKEIVNAVPSVSVAKDNVIYLLKAVSGNTYEMYSLVTLPDNSKAMASLGSTEIDLDGYLTEANAQRLYLALSTVKEEVLAKFNSVTEEGILYLTFNGSKVLTLSQLESLFYTKEEIDGMIGEAVVDDTKTSSTTAYSSEKVQDFMDETNEEIGKLNDSLVDYDNAKVREFLPSGDLNTIVTEGLYSIGHLSNFTNAPRTTDEHGVLRITKSSSDMVCQEWIPRNGNMSYRVQISGTTWGNWQELATMDKVARFPDYSRRITMTVNTWVATEDVYVTFFRIDSGKLPSADSIKINNVGVGVSDFDGSGSDNVGAVTFNGYVRKGSTIESIVLTNVSSCKIYPLI